MVVTFFPILKYGIILQNGVIGMEYNLVDVLIVLVITLSALKGYRNGLVGSVVNFFGSILALIFSIKFYKSVVQALEAKFEIVTLFAGFLEDKVSLPMEVGTLPVGANGIFLLKASIEQMALPSIVKEQMVIKIQDLMQVASQLGISTTGGLLTYLIALTLINGLVFILLWFLGQQMISLIAKFFSSAFDHTFIGLINHVAGFLIGAALSILGLMITIGLANLLLEITQGIQFAPILAIADKINQSRLVPYLQLGYDMILAKIITFI